MVVLSRHLPAKLMKWQLGHLVALLTTEGAIFTVHFYTFLKLLIYHDKGGGGQMISSCRQNEQHLGTDHVSLFPSLCVHHWHSDTCRFWLGPRWAAARSEARGCGFDTTIPFTSTFPLGRAEHCHVSCVFFSNHILYVILFINMIIRKFILSTPPFLNLECHIIYFSPQLLFYF